jgi:hypothetical protein
MHPECWTNIASYKSNIQNKSIVRQTPVRDKLALCSAAAFGFGVEAVRQLCIRILFLLKGADVFTFALCSIWGKEQVETISCSRNWWARKEMKERRREIPFVVECGDQRTPRAKRLHSAFCKNFGQTSVAEVYFNAD